MDPVTIGLLVAGASAAVGGGLSYMGAQSTNATNVGLSRAAMQQAWDTTYWQTNANLFEAQKARNWSERMSSTAYQRATEDMRAAGLNPLLAYQQGGASTPAAAVGSAAGPGVPSAARVENAMGQAVTAAAQVANTINQARLGAAQIQNVEADTVLKAAQNAQTQAATAKTMAETRTEEGRPANVEAHTGLLRTQQGAARAQEFASMQTGALAAAQAANEPDRGTLLRSQAGEAIERGNLARTDWRQRETYGPPGHAASTVGTVSQVLDQIQRSMGIRW